MTRRTSTSRRKQRHRRGKRAEILALLLLMLKAYRPLSRRFKTPVGEIDLILRRGNVLVFVEVKARASLDQAAEAVHAKNQARVVRAAQYFLHGHPEYAGYEVRFDVCLVPWYGWPKHLTHAFTL
jgi:putative endonuclease